MTSTWLKDAARRRAARDGCSYQRALQALTRYADEHGWNPLSEPKPKVDTTFTPRKA
ncbi:hypothetical protein [Nocardia fluminea]|uniref:hypothetical protein n=1 Tax=Nocardia fluminea TaxID=134984 RepID=UPI00365FAF51